MRVKKKKPWKRAWLVAGCAVVILIISYFVLTPTSDFFSKSFTQSFNPLSVDERGLEVKIFKLLNNERTQHNLPTLTHSSGHLYLTAKEESKHLADFALLEDGEFKSQRHGPLFASEFIDITGLRKNATWIQVNYFDRLNRTKSVDVRIEDWFERTLVYEEWLYTSEGQVNWYGADSDKDYWFHCIVQHSLMGELEYTGVIPAPPPHLGAATKMFGSPHIEIKFVGCINSWSSIPLEERFVNQFKSTEEYVDWFLLDLPGYMAVSVSKSKYGVFCVILVQLKT